MIDKSISVFLPALNEEENIKSCLLSVKRYLHKRFKDYEILVISDGSTDNTEKIVREFAKKDQHIRSIHHEKNLGYGAALRSGFTNSSKELIFYTDADNQFNVEEMDRLFPLLNSYDIVSGYRIKRQDPLMRIFIAWVYNLLIRILFNLKVKDIDASFKLYKKDVFKKIRLKANTGLVDAEILIKARKNGFFIGQIGVTHYPRIKGITTVRPKIIIDIFKEIKILWQELR